MGVTSEILGNAGAPYRLEFDGRTYNVRLIDQVVKDGWEKRFFERDAKKLEILRPVIGEEEYQSRKHGMEADLMEGGYELLSPEGLKFAQTIPGVQLLLSLLVGCTQDELVPLVAAKKEEVLDLLSRVLRESFPGMDRPAAGQAPPN